MHLTPATRVLIGVLLAVPCLRVSDLKAGRATMGESILDATSDDLKLAEAKITYLGEQSKPISSVVFYSRDYRPVMEHFLRVQSSSEPYSNDRSPYTLEFAVQPDEFQRMLSSVKPVITKADAGPRREFLSFSVVRIAGAQIIGQEFHITAKSAHEFYPALLGALSVDNSSGRIILKKQFTAACR